MSITLNYHILATFHTISKRNFSKLCKEFCKENFNTKLVFNSFKIKNYFAYEDPIPNDSKSFLVYSIYKCQLQFGKTCRHFKTRIEGHIRADNKSHIFKHLHSFKTCFDSYNSLCFKIIDKTNPKFDLKIKEAFHINWRKPNLNSQQNHLGLTLSLQLLFSLVLCAFVSFSFSVFCISLSGIVFIISTLIIGTFYCLSYTLLLLHLFIMHLVIDFVITM